MPGGERFARPEVCADVFADGRVGASPRLDGKNSAVRRGKQKTRVQQSVHAYMVAVGAWKLRENQWRERGNIASLHSSPIQRITGEPEVV